LFCLDPSSFCFYDTPVNHADFFDHHADFNPTGDFEAFLKLVPAKWVVYLLCDENDQPVQLLCVRNLRASLKRRLGPQEVIAPSRRISYSQLIRHVYWRRVDSEFEADLKYLEAARAIFPHTYQGMVGYRPAWFIHVDPQTNFPRYTKTTRLLGRQGLLFGPLEDKHIAAKLIELVEDCFDLCRYFHILIQAPHGRACAYKEMGKCPAPCDGSISMDQYHRMIEWSAATLADPTRMQEDQTHRMNQAAAELRFEMAGRIKAFVNQLALLGKGPLRHVRRLSEFLFVVFQPGPRAGTAKLFLVTPAEVDEILGFIREPAGIGDLLRYILKIAQNSVRPIDEHSVEQVSVVAHHLFAPKRSAGVFIPIESLVEKTFLKGYRDQQKQQQKEITDVDDEGMMKELQAL
jgi:hypothetical protein